MHCRPNHRKFNFPFSAVRLKIKDSNLARPRNTGQAMARRKVLRGRIRFWIPLFLLPLLQACGGRSGITALRPISVYLPISTVHLTAGAMKVSVPILIGSTSETALVSLIGLPAGVQVTYSSSDTNPSGSLTFSATSTASAGSYMPTVIVMSAGTTASAAFALVVQTP